MNIFKPILICIFVFASNQLLAKDYIVEMIFFTDKHANPASSHIPTQAIQPILKNALFLDETAASYGFLPIPPDAMALNGQANALAKTGRYKILKHTAWLQPGLAREEAIAVRIHAGKNYQNEFKERTYIQADFSDQKLLQKKQPVNELDGTIKVVLGRYLHVYTDLAYRRPFIVSPDSEINTFGRNRVLADYEIKTHRKMRSKQLHYIDHPLLGILVEIRPVDS